MKSAAPMLGVDHQPAEWEQIVIFAFLDVYWTSSDSNDLWYKSGVSKTTTWCNSEVCWDAGITQVRFRQHRAKEMAVHPHPPPRTIALG